MNRTERKPNQQLRVIPGRAASLIQVVLGIVFLLFGIVFLYFRVAEVTEPELRLLILLFGVLWIAVCGSISGYGIYSLKKRNAPLFTIESETDAGSCGDHDTPDFDTRLKKLESLKKEGIISEKEYRQKRAEIMEEKW